MKPIVCCVTDRHELRTADPVPAALERVRAAVAAAVDWVQIREKDLGARELLGMATRAVAASTEGTRVIVNDRLDVALAAGAAGVHLGRESLPAADVVRWCKAGNAPQEFTVGVSCHSVEEARAAEQDGASYVFFGPVFDTPSKRTFGPPQGVERLREVCHAVRVPVVAIGGVNIENAREC